MMQPTMSEKQQKEAVVVEVTLESLLSSQQSHPMH
jgi:hypothetical protein